MNCLPSAVKILVSLLNFILNYELVMLKYDQTLKTIERFII